MDRIYEGKKQKSSSLPGESLVFILMSNPFFVVLEQGREGKRQCWVSRGWSVKFVGLEVAELCFNYEGKPLDHLKQKTDFCNIYVTKAFV